ncbi:Hypothetical predicted protein, partial [Pelobates cultripes]
MSGDINHLLDPILDSTRPPTSPHYKTLKKQSRSLRNLLATYGLRDVWRALHPAERAYTHHSKVHNKYSRIDGCFMHESTMSNIMECDILNVDWSDHAPTTLTLASSYEYKHRNPWRLNDYLLKDTQYCKTLENELHNYFTTNASNDLNSHTIWLAHKAVLRGTLISRSKKTIRKRNNTIQATT